MTVEIPALGIVYKPVPKAACTSIKAALAGLDPGFPFSREEMLADPSVVHMHYRTRRFRPHRWRPYCDGTWWRFAVVRDPLKRLLSVYSNRVVDKAELFNSPKLRRQSYYPPDPDPDFFFRNLSAYMELSWAIRHHVLPQHLFVGPAPLQFDRVYRTDELGVLANDLSERAGRGRGGVSIPRLNLSRSRLTLADLGNRTIEMIGERLAPEYAHLDGLFDNPFGRPIRWTGSAAR